MNSWLAVLASTTRQGEGGVEGPGGGRGRGGILDAQRGHRGRGAGTWAGEGEGASVFFLVAWYREFR